MIDLSMIFLLIAIMLDGTNSNSNSSNTNTNANANTLMIGRAINIFNRFGYFYVTMKVVARNETNTNWIFREPVCTILNNVEKYATNRLPISLFTKKKAWQGFPGHFHMEFCDNSQQLVQAYFRDFTIDGFDKPWRAFSAGWHPESIARHFGITDYSFMRENYSYILVRLTHYRKSIHLDSLPPTVRFVDSLNDEIKKLKINDTISVVQFMRKFGSHYIEGYTTGNCLFQVFVFQKSHYYEMKTRFVKHGFSSMANNGLLETFSPLKAAHIGEIRTSSGNGTVEKWCQTHLQTYVRRYDFQSMLKLYVERDLFTTVHNMLTNEALLQIKLKSLEMFFENDNLRKWFREVILNLSNLWDLNL